MGHNISDKGDEEVIDASDMSGDDIVSRLNRLKSEQNSQTGDLPKPKSRDDFGIGQGIGYTVIGGDN
jgi:hypothetical protein